MDECKTSNSCIPGAIQSPLTVRVLDDVTSLSEQSHKIQSIVSKMRDALGIYNMPAQVWNCAEKQCSEPSPAQPSISDAEREMKRIINRNDRIIDDFENLLKNV